MKTFNIGFGDSYPHYYTLKAVDGKPENQIVTGIAQITGAYLNDSRPDVGDFLKINGIEYRIDGYIEELEPKGKHIKPATWFRVNTTYMRNVG